MAVPGFNPSESPLGRLATRKGANGEAFLTHSEFAAGERLRLDFTRGNLTPSVTQRWETASRGSGGRSGVGDLSDSAIDARARIDGAIRAVGPELGGVVLDVCCFLKGLELVERERQWPARSAKLLLKAGLAALARHYRFDHVAEGGPGRIRRWAAPGARPKAQR